MKSIIILSLIASVFVSTTRAAYGGGGSSISSTSFQTTLSLQRDVCPGGDASASYYDGNCGESTETAGFTTQAVKKTDTAHEIAGTIDHIALIKERKAKIEVVKDITLNVPLQYRVKLKKVDTAMDDWLDKGSVERQVKLLRLYKKIQLLKERVSNEKSRAILGYVEEKLISLLDRKLLEK